MLQVHSIRRSQNLHSIMFDIEFETDRLENAAIQLVETLGGDLQKALKYLILENAHLEAELRELRANVSTGFMRGSMKKCSAIVGDRLKR